MVKFVKEIVPYVVILLVVILIRSFLVTPIKVNGQRIVTPYIIKAIGNPTYLESALIGNGGPVDNMQKIGHDVSIEKPNKVTIPKYNGEIKTKYIQ